MKNISFIICWFMLSAGFAQTPSQVPAKQGKNGIYILLSAKGFSEKNPLYDKFTSVTIQRAVNNDNFKEIGKLKAAATPEEFEKLISKDALLSIAGLKKLSSKQEAWQYVQSHPEIKDYGILALELNLGVALGAYFLDKDLAGIPAGSLVKYKIIVSDGREGGELTASINITQTAALQKPVLIAKAESDSVISMEWTALSSKSPDVMFGNIYVKTGNPAEFKFLQRVFANKDERGDTVRFKLIHIVTPGIQFQYYIKPATMAMQEGMASDTVIATSLNFSTLDQPLDLRAKDTTNGIFLTWKLTQNTNARKSIIIERTANMEKPFITIATLPASALSFTDFSVQPSFTYYYRVRIATIANTVLPPSSHVSNKHRFETFTPEPPRHVKASLDKNGVRITWSKVNNPDVAGYFVTRNNGIDTIYEPVSLLVKDTFLLDTSQLYGRNNYTWAVRVFTFSDKNSEPAYSSSISVNNTIKPIAPFGGRSYAQPGLVHLSWDDTKKSDLYVSGYRIYRKSGASKTGTEVTGESFRKAGFEQVAETSENTYTDKNNKAGEWQYAVTSLDVFGKESDVGFVQSVNVKAPYIAIPEQFSVRKTSKGISIEWDIVKQDGVKTYTIYKRSATETTAVKLTTVDISKGVYVDINVKSGTLYYYSLSAAGDDGSSGASAEKFAKY